MKKMSTIRNPVVRKILTFFKISKYAWKGIEVRDKWLSFLLAALSVTGVHRVGLRLWFIRRISALARNNEIVLRIICFDNPLVFNMRAGNEGDYLIGGELVSGDYGLPDFLPQRIVDGGAHIGKFSIYAGLQFPKADLVCYEPSSENYQFLQKNLLANNVKAVTHNKGLWSKEVTLYFQKGLFSGIGMITETGPGEPIPCDLPKIGANCWLKLDIEGSEYEVLPALFKLKEYPRWISMELHYFNTKGNKLLDLLRAHGYSIVGGDDPNLDCVIIAAYRSGT